MEHSKIQKAEELNLTKATIVDDCVCGEVLHSWDTLTNVSRKATVEDRVDTDLEAHVKTYLANLPVSIDFEHLNNLLFTDPSAVLIKINDIRAEIEHKIHTAQKLKALCQSQLA